MADGLFGKNWTMNRGQSILGLGSHNPDSETRLYQEVENGYSLTVTGSKGGNPYQWGYVALYDGQPHPVYGRQDVDAITAYKISDKITIGFFTNNAVPGGPYARFVSDDGNSLVVWAGGRNANGAPYFDVIKYAL